MMMTQQKARHLVCCCCGSDAGRWEQWHNQDKGFGLCGSCAIRIKTKSIDDELRSPLGFSRTYGLPGVNFEPTEYQQHYGRHFAVVASFPCGEQGEKEANEFMEWFTDTAVLGEFDGRIILALASDEGKIAVGPVNV